MSTEQQLRDLFAADAADAPAAGPLAADAVRKARETRRVRTVAAAAVLAAAGVLGVVVLVGGPEQGPDSPAAASSGPVSGAPTVGPAPTGAVPLGANVDCGPAYSPSELARADFAFDGIVVAIDPVEPADERIPVSVAEVTFDVQDWFRGGSAETVTVEMEAPTLNRTAPLYGAGSRLLVPGAVRTGGESDRLVGWDYCGFTRYWDPVTAADWAAATR